MSEEDARVTEERLEQETPPGKNRPLRNAWRMRFSFAMERKPGSGWCSVCRGPAKTGVIVRKWSEKFDPRTDAHHVFCVACVACMAAALPDETMA
jgi:hypothetical protein